MAKRPKRPGSWLGGDPITLERLERHAVLTHELLRITGAATFDEAVAIVERWARERRCATN